MSDELHSLGSSIDDAAKHKSLQDVVGTSAKVATLTRLKGPGAFQPVQQPHGDFRSAAQVATHMRHRDPGAFQQVQQPHGDFRSATESKGQGQRAKHREKMRTEGTGMTAQWKDMYPYQKQMIDAYTLAGAHPTGPNDEGQKTIKNKMFAFATREASEFDVIAREAASRKESYKMLATFASQLKPGVHSTTDARILEESMGRLESMTRGRVVFKAGREQRRANREKAAAALRAKQAEAVHPASAAQGVAETAGPASAIPRDAAAANTAHHLAAPPAGHEGSAARVHLSPR
jgi:hypothetical protein